MSLKEDFIYDGSAGYNTRIIKENETVRSGVSDEGDQWPFDPE